MNGGPGLAVALPQTRDGRPILSRAALDAYDPGFRHCGGRDRFYCPVHGGDHQRSLSVDPQSGVYCCHTCQASGTLREYWPSSGGVTQSRTPAPSIMQIGQQAMARREREDDERVARLAAPLPATAAAFLARLDAMSAALRDADCPGNVYLRGRGLDPLQAAELGAGYAAPNAWPGDRGRKVGRVVYPLADPLTGRVVSAVGRLCVDADPAWTDERVATFAHLKQRKLKDCPAGIWPYASMSAARATRSPLVLVEGPADALAVLQRPDAPKPVVALVGVANVVPVAALRGLAGVVLALDDDEAGAKASRDVRADLALAGVRVATPVAGWLHGHKDVGALASVGAGDDTWAPALHALAAACRSVGAQPTAWDTDRATDVLAGLYARLADAQGRASGAAWDAWLDGVDAELDAACAARDAARLMATVQTADAQLARWR